MYLMLSILAIFAIGAGIAHLILTRRRKPKTASRQERTNLPILEEMLDAMKQPPDFLEVKCFNGNSCKETYESWQQAHDNRIAAESEGYRKFICGIVLDGTATHWFAFGPLIDNLVEFRHSDRYAHEELMAAAEHYHIAIPTQKFPSMCDGGGIAHFVQGEVLLGDSSVKYGQSEFLLENDSTLGLLGRALGCRIEVVENI